MRVQVGEEVYQLKFIHAQGEIPTKKLSASIRQVTTAELRGTVTPIRGYTICSIYLLKDDQWYALSEGTAYCSLEDNFVKRVGRKHSLQRALSGCTFPLETRRAFWRAAGFNS